MSKAYLIGATIKQSDDRRRAERHSLPDGTSAEIDDHEPVAVIDISIGGFRAICMRPMQQGDAVILLIEPNPAMPARVIWTNEENMIGCEFASPLSDLVLLSIIENSPTTI